MGGVWDPEAAPKDPPAYWALNARIGRSGNRGHAAHHIYEFDKWALAAETAEVANAARNLASHGLTSANAIVLDAPESGLWFGGHGGGTANPNVVNVAVLERSRAKAAKLLKADADELRLCVWMEESWPGAQSAMHTGELPETPPQPAPGVDVVWVGSMRGEVKWNALSSDPWMVVSAATVQLTSRAREAV